MISARQNSNTVTPAGPALRGLQRHAVPAICLAVFSVVFVILAIAPADRETWFLESLITLVVVPGVVLTYRRHRFSDRAYVQGTVFLILHTIGSHYTYSDVPLGEWMDRAFDLGRNHYDRAIHFAAGILLLRVNRELFFARGPRLSALRELWLSIGLIAFWSVLYELLEWWAAILVDPAAGTAFLGTQGDPWDAQKDMGLACLGALIAAGVELVLERSHRS